jgi:hypothetical protein
VVSTLADTPPVLLHQLSSSAPSMTYSCTTHSTTPSPHNLITTSTTTPSHLPPTPTQQPHPPPLTRQFSRVQAPPPLPPKPAPDSASTKTSDDDSSTTSTHPHDFPTTHTKLNTPLLLSTSVLYPEALPSTHNFWHHGLHFISSKYNHHPPDIRSTWRQHLKRSNKSNFLNSKPLLYAPSPSHIQT